MTVMITKSCVSCILLAVVAVENKWYKVKMKKAAKSAAVHNFLTRHINIHTYQYRDENTA
jgi:plastocyanin domain-containing protein